MTREQDQELQKLADDLENDLPKMTERDQADVEKVLAALRAALATIRALPVTADGVRVVPGMMVWHDHPTQVLHWDVVEVSTLIDGDHLLHLKRHTQYGRNECTAKGWQVYSTAAEARAAREGETKS